MSTKTLRFDPLLATAGVPWHLRELLPAHERMRHRAEGLAIYISASLAGLGAYLGSQLFVPGLKHVWALAACAAWCLIMWHVDRGVVLSWHAVRKQHPAKVMLRVLIALISSFLVADQFVLAVFRDRLVHVRESLAIAKAVEDRAQLERKFNLAEALALEHSAQAELQRLQTLKETRPADVVALDATVLERQETLRQVRAEVELITVPLQNEATALATRAARNRTLAVNFDVARQPEEAERLRRAARWHERAAAQKRDEAALIRLRMDEPTRLLNEAVAERDDALKAHHSSLSTHIESAGTALAATQKQNAELRRQFTKDQAKASASSKRAFAANLIAEQEAMAQLRRESPSVIYVQFGLQALLLLIELLPLIFLMFGSSSVLTELLHEEASTAIAQSRQRSELQASAAEIEATAARDAAKGYILQSAASNCLVWRQAAELKLRDEQARRLVETAFSAMTLEMDLARRLGDRWVQDAIYLAEQQADHPGLAEKLAELGVHARERSINSQRAALEELCSQLHLLRKGAGVHEGMS
jgi:hypothetical protein